MKRLTLCLFGFLIGTTGLSAQDVAADFGWMEGQWKGTGWVMDPQTREKTEFMQYEDIELGAGNTVVIIQGTGKDPKSEEEIFSAAGLLYWDREAEAYKMHAHTERDGGVLADIDFKEPGLFTWGFDVPGGRVEYDLDARNDVWTEKGFFKPQGSNERYPFMQMTVEKYEATD